MSTSRPLSLRFMLCPRLSPVLHRRRLLGMPRGIPAGRGAAGARGTPRRGAVGAAPRRGMPRGLATRDMRGLASLVIFLTNLLIGFLLALAADQPPPPLSFARRPRHNRPPWADPFFLRRDKSSLAHCLRLLPFRAETIGVFSVIRFASAPNNLC